MVGLLSIVDKFIIRRHFIMETKTSTEYTIRSRCRSALLLVFESKYFESCPYRSFKGSTMLVCNLKPTQNLFCSRRSIAGAGRQPQNPITIRHEASGQCSIYTLILKLTFK